MPAIKDCQPDRTLADRAIIEHQRHVIRLLSEHLVSATKTNRDLCRQLAEARKPDNYHTDLFSYHVGNLRLILNDIEQKVPWMRKSCDEMLNHLVDGPDKVDFVEVRRRHRFKREGEL